MTILLRGTRKLHFKFFDKPYCQRDNWRGTSQQFFFARAAQRVTCKNCRRFAEIGR
jgi:hypothetical protein